MLKIVDLEANGGVRGYSTAGDRRRAVAMLRKSGFNYFVGFRDFKSKFALNYGRAAWVKKGIHKQDV